MNSSIDLSQQLQQGVLALGLELSPETQNTLLAYLERLSKWNQSYNLTAISNPREMLTHHLLDSLSLARFLQGPKILDVGTGAGFPGIPLALAFPDYELVLLDSNGKKLRFIAQAISELKIRNVRLVHSRVENFREEPGFSDIIARAVSSVSIFVNNTRHLLALGGQWLAMKGLNPQAELCEIHQPYHIESLEVPGLEAERHVVILKE